MSAETHSPNLGLPNREGCDVEARNAIRNAVNWLGSGSIKAKLLRCCGRNLLGPLPVLDALVEKVLVDRIHVP